MASDIEYTLYDPYYRPATADTQLSVQSSERQYSSYKRLKLPRVSFSRSLEAGSTIPPNVLEAGSTIPPNVLETHEITAVDSPPPRRRIRPMSDPRYLPWEKLPKYSWRRSEQMKRGPAAAPDRFYLQTFAQTNIPARYTKTSIQHGLRAPDSMEEVLSEQLNSSSRRRRLRTASKHSSTANSQHSQHSQHSQQSPFKSNSELYTNIKPAGKTNHLSSSLSSPPISRVS